MAQRWSQSCAAYGFALAAGCEARQPPAPETETATTASTTALEGSSSLSSLGSSSSGTPPSPPESTTGSSPSDDVCGNGRRDYGEHCDDGNRERGDGCSQWCTTEPTEVFAGFHHSCALLADGRAKCWGDNGMGQLGLGDRTSRGHTAEHMGHDLGFVHVAGHRIEQLALGLDFTCALLDDGTVRCWGGNAFGQLGLGDLDPRGVTPDTVPSELPAVDLPGIVTQISAGARFTCAAFEDHRVTCWGLNERNELGAATDGTVVGDAPSEMGEAMLEVDLAGEVLQRLSSGGPTCVLGEAGSVRCWGRTINAELPSDGPIPYVALGHELAFAIAVGGEHACAQTLVGVRCWGANEGGQLGAGHTNPTDSTMTLPVDLGASVPIAQLAAGRGHTCVRFDQGSIKCWGANEYGQLGLEHTNTIGDGPAEMNTYLPATFLGAPARSISAKHDHTCALLENRSIKCWGRNVYGELGLGDSIDRGGNLGDMGDYLPAVDLGL